MFLSDVVFFFLKKKDPMTRNESKIAHAALRIFATTRFISC